MKFCPVVETIQLLTHMLTKNFTRSILKTKRKKWALLNWVLSSGGGDASFDTQANKKLENIENNFEVSYVSFISTKLDSKKGQIKGLDITFQMRSIAIISNIVEYLKN